MAVLCSLHLTATCDHIMYNYLIFFLRHYQFFSIKTLFLWLVRISYVINLVMQDLLTLTINYTLQCKDTKYLHDVIFYLVSFSRIHDTRVRGLERRPQSVVLPSASRQHGKVRGDAGRTPSHEPHVPNRRELQAYPHVARRSLQPHARLLVF